ncbi:threonine/homoserine exporter RhtA [Escherichia coli]
MPGSLRKMPVWLPIIILLVAMASIQGGASLAKSLFPLVGAPGVTALRLALGTLILIAFFKPWRLRFAKQTVTAVVLRRFAGWDELSFLSFYSDSTAGYCGGAGIHRTTGGGAVLFSSPGRFRLGCAGGSWSVVPATAGARRFPCRFNRLCAGTGGRACWAIYILSGQRAGAEHGPATVAIGSLIAALIFVPIGALQAGEALWHWSVIPLGLAVAILSTALPYSLEVIALTRLPTRTFGTLMSMEPALAAVSGMIFLGETLTPIQLLALGAIIAASMGSTLTVRKESKIKELDIN